MTRIIKLFTLQLCVCAFAIATQAQTIDSNFDLAKLHKSADDVDSSPASPPLETDDTGTPGRSGYEIQFITDCDITKTDNTCESVINAAFGVGQNAQLRVVRGVTRSKESGQPAFVGLGPTGVGVKYRFFDKNGLKLAVYPDLRLNDATKQTFADGTVAPTEGTSIYLPLIITDQFGRLAIGANIGRRFNFVSASRDSTFTSLAVGYPTGRTSLVMAEVASEATSNDRRTDFRVGWSKNISPRNWHRYKASFFTSYGQSLRTSADGKIHRTLLIGVSVARKPSGD